jgi:hypothetical protein
MMKMRFAVSVLLSTLCLAAGTHGSRLSFQEHAAVQEPLARPRHEPLDKRPFDSILAPMVTV